MLHVQGEVEMISKSKSLQSTRIPYCSIMGTVQAIGKKVAVLLSSTVAEV
jgi:hypothetical protein